MPKTKKSMTYQEAGVDIEKADHLVTTIARLAKATHRPGVVSGIGGFGSLFEIPSHFKKPLLVSSTDGVGTKLKIAIEMKYFNTIGIDLVAMCANDVVTTGAEPLFFLDYYAMGKLDSAEAKTILKSISEGCQLAGMALVGGETAEMPGLYQPGDFDLAGFCVGAVEKDKLIDTSCIHVGDALIALASSGVHSNGYSLVRKIMTQKKLALTDRFETSTLGNTLLTPTRIYVKPLLQLLSAMEVHGIAHITGGGIINNLPRILPSNTRALVDLSSFTPPNIFRWIQEKGHVDEAEMHRTFNMGVGIILAVPQTKANHTIDLLHQQGEKAWVIGRVEKSSQQEPNVVMKK